jgi:predicted GNAT superfamily acetyltransferase
MDFEPIITILENILIKDTIHIDREILLRWREATREAFHRVYEQGYEMGQNGEVNEND